MPEEIVITGERSTVQLRVQLMEAEERAYDIFNKFNDDRRFEISCSQSAPTGSRLLRQVCQAEFEIQAMRSHAQDFYDGMSGPGRPPQGSVNQAHLPMAAELQRHRKAYREKMRQVAEEHPEFVDALARYAALKQQYEERIGQSE